MIYYIEIMLQIRRKETKYLSSFSLGKKMDFSSFLTEMVRGNLFMKPIHFTASLSHNKPKKKKKKERHSTTFPAPQPGGTFTNLLAVDGDRKKKLENRDIKKACPYQGFFTKVLHKQVYSVLNIELFRNITGTYGFITVVAGGPMQSLSFSSVNTVHAHMSRCY